ncbi:hypothetical protein CW306_13780 [Bacillus sp. BA3]|uniref:hypothetical protein n=1 Tax=Bacillus sp. BA3 TaxID=2057910 RepID=UPI000C337AAB|nr:hypothetical protein [Bacillus sp. BA3]PKF88429.1 hypothetical protein CW306_13780 [Bacillus sp. BA3]
MKKFFQFIKWLAQAASIPLILVLVWFFNVRPFSFLFNYVDSILTVDLSTKYKQKGVPDAIFGAIDVAFLTFIYNFSLIILSKIFSKPAKVSIEIHDRKSNKNFVTIPFDEERIESQDPTSIKLKGEIEINYAKWLFDYILKGIRISIQWHPKWLSVVPQIKGASEIITNSHPGVMHFNFMDLLSESDSTSTIDGKLSILANSNFKRDGNINVKIEVNSKYKIIRVCFNWVIRLLVKSDLKPCNISLEKGS